MKKLIPNLYKFNLEINPTTVQALLMFFNPNSTQKPPFSPNQ